MDKENLFYVIHSENYFLYEVNEKKKENKGSKSTKLGKIRLTVNCNGKLSTVSVYNHRKNLSSVSFKFSFDKIEMS